MGQVWSKKPAAPPAEEPTTKPKAPLQRGGAGSGKGSGRPAELTLEKRMTAMAEETRKELTKKATIVVDEARAALERNNTVVSMSSTGAHTFSDAGIHLPHELHLPKTGLSHEANSALGAVTAAVIAAGVVSPIMTVIDLSIIKSQFQKIPMGQAIKHTAGDLFAGRARWQVRGWVGGEEKERGEPRTHITHSSTTHLQPALGIMGGVYFSTYMAANGVEAWCTVRTWVGGWMAWAWACSFFYSLAAVSYSLFP